MHLAEMSKLQPERRLGCCTLQLDLPRRSGTYADLKFDRIVLQSTLPIFPLRAALRTNFDIFKFCMFIMHFCKLLEIIVLGSTDTRIHQFRMTFKLPCGILTSQIYYQKVVMCILKPSCLSNERSQISI